MGLCLPVAVLLGYFLAEPMDTSSLGVVVLVLSVLCVPLLMKWNHPLLVLGWNAMMMLPFLPGNLLVSAVIGPLAFLFAVLNRSVNPDRRFIRVPSVSRALLFLTAIIVGTAFLTGGIGFRVLGSSHFGGKRYINIFAAVLGYFALTSRQIPIRKVGTYVGMFFLPGLTALIGNLATMGGPGLYFLCAAFPISSAVSDGESDFAPQMAVYRFGGFPVVSVALYSYLLARYGLQGVLDLRKPWRMLFFAMATLTCLAGGFRSAFIAFGLTLVILFFMEGLHRTRLLPICLSLGILGAAILLPQAHRLPQSIQRTLSFLPAKVDPIVENEARGSSEWRVNMWKVVWPEVPKYLLKGKGYVLSPSEMFSEGGDIEAGGGSRISGDYHNGPLSILIPFGLLGMAGFVWFLIACIRALYRYFQFGEPELRHVNAFLLASFITKSVLFFVVFGSLYSDLMGFAGLIGFAVCLNGSLPVPQEAEESIPDLIDEPYSVRHGR
jgi:hypothetical protein